jgi:hypothetical protein
MGGCDLDLVLGRSHGSGHQGQVLLLPATRKWVPTLKTAIRTMDTSYPKCLIPRYSKPCHSEDSHLGRLNGAVPP